MDAVWAEEKLKEPGLTPDGVYELTLRATGDKAEAAQQKAYALEAKRRREFMAGNGDGG